MLCVCMLRSIGVLAYVMLTGISPFLGEDKQETFLNISQLNVSYTDEELQHLDQAALSFIQMLLRKQPQLVHTAVVYMTYKLIWYFVTVFREGTERKTGKHSFTNRLLYFTNTKQNHWLSF